MAVRDLWKGKDLGTLTGSFTAKAVPSHGAVRCRAAQWNRADSAGDPLAFSLRCVLPWAQMERSGCARASGLYPQQCCLLRLSRLLRPVLAR